MPKGRLLVLGLMVCSALLLSACTESMMTIQAIGSNRSVGSQVNDITLESRALIAIHQMSNLPADSHVDVSSFNGMVLVLGQVPHRTLRYQITQKLRYLPGAKVIYNRLSIGPGNDIFDIAKDSMISANVKANLAKAVNPLDFKVVTNNGIVYLLGLTTPNEGRLALKAAQHAMGAKQVVPLFSYEKPNRAKIISLNSR